MPVPNVRVTATNAATGVTITTQTNGAGFYEFPVLNPGTYTVVAQLGGFASYRRENVQLVLQQRLSVDITMELAALTESIVVSGAPTLLDTETARATQLITSDQVTELPVFGRAAHFITRLVPGAVPTTPADVRGGPAINMVPSDIAFNGTPPAGNGILLDGVTDTYSTGVYSVVPSTEAIEEVQVQTFALSAEYGQTAGAVVSYETKHGTNTPHGSLWWNLANTRLNANDFFSNFQGLQRIPLKSSHFGAALGGPIFLPKVYSGKNRTFFFFSYEGQRDRRQRSQLLTTPTALERDGDFSQTFTGGQLIRIYDPFTTRLDPQNPNRFIRDPFPDNTIPKQVINPVGQNVVRFMPLPNLPGVSNNLLNAWGAIVDTNLYTARVDHQFNEKQMLALSYSEINYFSTQTKAPTNTISTIGGNGWRFHRVWALSATHVFNPTTILNFRGGVQYMQDYRTVFPTVADRESLGFPNTFLSSLRVVGNTFPGISGSDIPTLGEYDYRQTYTTPDIRPYVTKIVNRHSLNFGYEFRTLRVNGNYGNGTAGTFQFTQAWTQGPDASVSSKTAGRGAASLLLGTPASGSVNINASSAAQTLYHALYVQDAWRLTQRLTINLGLRWDYETPVSERFNRVNRGFDSQAVNPIAEQAAANYARNPIPEVPASDFNVRGGLLFAGASGEARYAEEPVRGNFMPRVGLAYQLIPNKMVVRAGYGLFYAPLLDNSSDTVGQQNALPLSQLGFSSTTAMQTSLGGLPFQTLSDPFPQGLVGPIGSSLGLRTLLGESITVFDGEARRARSQVYQFGLQYQLPWQMVLDTAYVGSYNDKRAVQQDVNGIPSRFLSLQAGLSQNVANPFLGMIAKGTLSQPVLSKSQLLRPYPQFTGVNIQMRPIGSSRYDSLQASLNRRMAGGFLLGASYTYSKNMEKRGFLYWDLPLEKVISGIDHPHRLVVNTVWDLPVGLHRKHGGSLPRPLLHVIGDWGVSMIATFQSGYPPNFGDAVMTRPVKSIERSRNQWFDTAAFAPLPPFTVRTLSTRLSAVRSEGTKDFDVVLAREFRLREAMHLKFRAQCYNVFNTVLFSAPNTSVTSPSFGTVSAQANLPRYIELELKLAF